MPRNLRRVSWVLVVGTVFMFLGAVRSLRAQFLYGALVGNVSDPSGAAVPGAAVKITQGGTGLTREATSDSSGVYNVPTVPAGTYTVQVTKSGFKTFTRDNVGVVINNVTRLDVTLQLGPVTQTVEVTAAQAPLLTTDRADIHHDLAAMTLENVPIAPGRNYEQLFRALPGFNPPADSHSIPSNPSRSLEYNVNGTASESNDVRLDGASQSNVWLPHISAYVPSLEAIQTVNVVTNNFDVTQGLAGGSTVNVQLKSGTNSLHGALFEYHNDNALEAHNYNFFPFQKAIGTPKNVFNQFGGAVGGPIKKDKLFFFAAYEGTTVRQFAQKFATIPTLKMRTGDLTDSTTTLYDPTTGNPDGSGRKPLSCNGVINKICSVDPIAQKILSLLPPPNNPDAIGLNKNFLGQQRFTFDRHTVDAKVDWNATSRLRMYGRWSYLHFSDSQPGMFGRLQGPSISGFGSTTNTGTGFGHTMGYTLAGTFLFTPNFILDANFGFTRMQTNAISPFLDEKLGLDFLGIPGTNGTRRFEGGWPSFRVSNFANMGMDENFMPYIRDDPQYHWNANFNWIKGPHTARFGIDVLREDLNHQQAEFGGTASAAGWFEFSGGLTGCNKTDAFGKKCPGTNQFNSFASFLLGVVSARKKNFQVPDFFTTRSNEWGWYVGDVWQAKRNLTVNIGARVEYFPIPGRANRGFERYDAVNNQMLVCGVGSIPRDCGVDYNGWKLDPRIGIAYRVRETFVIRAGYGITSDPWDLARPLRTNYPTLVPFQEGGPNSFTPVSTLEQGIPPITVPDLGNGVLSIPGTVAAITLPPSYKRGYIQSWNFTLEKQFLKTWDLQAAYVATRSTKMAGVLDQNAGDPTVCFTDPKTGSQTCGGQASQPLRAKFGRTATTEFIGPIGNNHYNALQTTLKRHFNAGYEVHIAYTYAKTTTTDACWGNTGGGLCIKPPQFWPLNRGLSGLDIPHNFEALFIAQPPFGKDKRWAQGRIASAILGGWQVNGLFSSVSGNVFSVSASGTSLNAPGNTQRADQVKAQVWYPRGEGPGQSWFDPFAFAQVTDQRFGTVGFNTLRGPGIRNLDFGIFRQFSVSERWKIQFRAEAFNVTNTPHFSNPERNVSNNGFTEITGTRNLARAGIDPREFRLGLRISF